MKPDTDSEGDSDLNATFGAELSGEAVNEPREAASAHLQRQRSARWPNEQNREVPDIGSKPSCVSFPPSETLLRDDLGTRGHPDQQATPITTNTTASAVDGLLQKLLVVYITRRHHFVIGACFMIVGILLFCTGTCGSTYLAMGRIRALEVSVKGIYKYFQQNFELGALMRAALDEHVTAHNSLKQELSDVYKVVRELKQHNIYLSARLAALEAHTPASCQVKP